MDQQPLILTTNELAREYKNLQQLYWQTHDETLCVVMQGIVAAAGSLLDLAEYGRFLRITGPMED